MKSEKVVTVQQLIGHLQKLPPNMECWKVWEDSGEYFPIIENKLSPFDVTEIHIKSQDSFDSYPVKEWRAVHDKPNKGHKKVCVLHYNNYCR